MSATILDLAAERAHRRPSPATAPVAQPDQSPGPLNWKLSQRGNPYVVTDGFHVVVFRRQSGQWSFRIENLETEQAWFAERHYGAEDAARADALLAVRQLREKEPATGR